ncbi:MAG: hypothetical protein AAF722_12770, partial [Cyanobacteria bacterium P01_C01_bin.70]
MVQVNEQPESVRFYVGSNVEVAPDVAIATGAVLEAAPGAALIVAAGVCIGAGVVVQATGGKLVLEVGVNLGGGVLILGQGKVGAHACIGANSTLLNPQVESGAVLPMRSLLYRPDDHRFSRPAEPANRRSAKTTQGELPNDSRTIKSALAAAAPEETPELAAHSAVTKVV